MELNFYASLFRDFTTYSQKKMHCLCEKIKKIYFLVKTILETFLAEMRSLAEIIYQLPIKPQQANPADPDLSNPYAPVLLIHGFLHNSSAWNHLILYLQSKGHKNIYTIDLYNTLKSIETHSEKVAEMAKDIFQKTGKKSILIGHSMGGITALDAATKNQSYIHGVITISSPLSGTSLSKGNFVPSMEQMKIDSIYLDHLHKRIQKAKELDIRIIGNTGDMIVRPNQSTHEGIRHTKKIILENTGHLNILLAKKMHETVADWLREMSNQT